MKDINPLYLYSYKNGTDSKVSTKEEKNPLIFHVTRFSIG
jgi:hypothetical protein